jgi:integrase
VRFPTAVCPARADLRRGPPGRDAPRVRRVVGALSATRPDGEAVDGTRDKAKARAFLQQQEGKVALKIPVNVQADRLTLKDGAELIRRDYRANQRKSAFTLEYRLARLLAAFGADTRLSRLTTAAVQAYKDRRRRRGRERHHQPETAALARIATLAREEHGLVVPFVVTGLEERNARQGFFEPGDFEAVCRHLPSHLAALARTAYLTGWRKSELRSRQWHHVDFAHGSLRMEPEDRTKNRRGREFPLVPELARSWRRSGRAGSRSSR